MKHGFETAASKRPVEAPVAERGVRVRSEKETSERERGAMCASLSRSAKKIATLGAFLASANGVAGCAPSLQRVVSASEFAHPELEFPDSRQMADELEEKAGNVVSDIASQRKRVEVARSTENQESNRTELRGFETIGIDPLQMGQFVSAALPKSWSRRSNVSSVVIDPHVVLMPYPGFENKPEYGHCSRPDDGSPAAIEITSEKFKGPSVESEFSILFREVVFHEFAHANDWSSSPDLSSQEALELRYLVLKAVEAEGRPKFSYPEGIGSKTASPSKDVRRARMTEYFAELTSEALSLKTGSDQTSWDDWSKGFAQDLKVIQHATEEESRRNAHIMQWYFSHVDPSFRPWAAEKKGTEVSYQIIRTYQQRLFGKALKFLDDDVLRREIESGMSMSKSDFRPEDLTLQSRSFFMDVNGTGMATLRKFIAHAEAQLNGGEDEVLWKWIELVGVAGRIRQGAWEKKNLAEHVDRSGKLIAEMETEMMILSPDRQVVLCKLMLEYGRMMLTGHLDLETL